MTKAVKSALSMLLAFAVAAGLFWVPAFANGTVSSLSAAYSAGTVTVTGQTGADVHAVAVLIYSGSSLLRLETAGVTGGQFSAAISIALSYGTYTVKAADYEGGEYATKTFTYSAPPVDPGGDPPDDTPPPTSSGTTGTGTESSAKAVLSGAAGTINAEASVSGTRVVLSLDASQVSGVAQDGALSIDVSGLGSGISGATIPASVVSATSGLELVLGAAAVSFDADAILGLGEDAQGFDALTVSVEPVDTGDLTEEQAAIIPPGAPVLSLSAVAENSGTNESKTISRFGGKVNVRIPYTPGKDEDPSNVAVYFINDAGEVEKLACKYDAANGWIEFDTDHFSVYSIVGERIAAFMDVKLGDACYEAMNYVVETGLFAGTSATTLSPEAAASRAMLVTVLHRLEGKPDAGVGKSGTFVDVPENLWYTEAVEWAAAKGIIGGYGDGTFGPGDALTCEQMYTVLYRYAAVKDLIASNVDDSVLDGHEDADEIAAWAIPAMKWVLTSQIDTVLSPKLNATRGQMAGTLMKFLDQVE